MVDELATKIGPAPSVGSDDVVFAGKLDEWLDRFDSAVSGRVWNGFTVARKSAPSQINVETLTYRPWRVALQIRYEGRNFGSVPLVSLPSNSAQPSPSSWH